MAAIPSLLNPSLESDNKYDSTADSGNDTSTPIHSGLNSPTTAGEMSIDQALDKRNRKKQKMCKDAAVFKPGTVRGECRYPPDEFQDELLEAKHQMYEVYPVGDIATYARHIPYNSEKKLFWEKTGRESFEVFQYQFKIPGDENTYTMLWDYNIGLVRTTPLFKCGNYSKTTPAKMLSRNPGLKELCHSITGGALVAQGYWIPFEAAKAVAATFCWSIRFALTPVFGKDFPGTCLPPDHDDFGSMRIDPDITKFCEAQAKRYREIELANGSTRPSPSPDTSSSRTPQTPKVKPQLRKILPKPYRETDTASEYSTDTSRDDKYELSSPSPQIAFTNPWSAVNSPRSPSPKVAFTDPWSSPASTTRSTSPHGTSRKGKGKGKAGNIPRSHTPLDLLPPPLHKPLYPGINTVLSPGVTSDPGSARLPISAISPTTSTAAALRRMDVDEDYDAGSDESDAEHGEATAARKKSSRGVFNATKAAWALLNLKNPIAAKEEKKVSKGLKRRALSA